MDNIGTQLTKEFITRNKITELLLVDASNIIMGGLGASFSAGFRVFGSEGSSIRTGGVYSLVSFLTRKQFSHNHILPVFIFDRSSSNKKAFRDIMGIEKQSDYEFLATSTLMEQFLHKAGYNTLSIEDREADDIAYALVDNYYDWFRVIYLASNDRDWSGNLDLARKVTQLGINGSPELHSDNYSMAYGANISIPFGSLWIYRTIVGKPNEGRANDASRKLFRDILFYANEKGVETSMLQMRGASLLTLTSYFEQYPNTGTNLTPEHYMALFDMVIPQPINGIYLEEPHLNLQAIEDMCNLFRLKRAGSKFGITLPKTPSSREKEFIAYINHNILTNNFDFSLDKLYGISYTGKGKEVVPTTDNINLPQEDVNPKEKVNPSSWGSLL